MSIKAKIVSALGLNVLMWLAMWMVFAGLMFCAAGAYMALADRLTPVQAALITGGGLIAVVAILGLCALVASRSNKGSSDSVLSDSPDNALEHQLRPMIGDRATDWAKHNTGMAIVGALSAGVILTASPRLRSTLVRAVGPIFTRKAIRAFQQFSDRD
ncbi:hypothetical protein [Salinisphaera aquimarina]|uniref:Phage holin family protein n=1 Tax=Salinisphaera aquimarina TaxID=2094031 RepID=A0ABV7EQC3_9GAMM